MVNYRRIITLFLQDRKRGNTFIKNPLGHIVLLTINPPSSQFAIAIQQVTIEFETDQIACLGRKGTIIFINALILHIGGTLPKIVKVTDTSIFTHIGNLGAIIDWGFRSATSDITIEHTVHHHRLQVGSTSSSRCNRIITHYTTNCGSARDSRIAKAVDDTGSTFKFSDEATNIA